MQRILMAAIAAVATFTCLPAISPAAAAEKTKLVAETDWTPHGMTAGLMLAKQKGWFDEAGLDVDVLDGKGSNTTIQQVAVGQVDVGFVQLSAMAAAISNGLPVISVMGIVQAGDSGIFVPAASGWTTLKDLKGKRILVAAGSATSVFLDGFLKAGGVSRSDVSVISVDLSALASTYISGGADAALSSAFYFMPLVQKGRPSSMLLFSAYGLHVPSYGLIVRKSAIDKKGDAFRKFVEVQQRTWTYILAGHEKEAVDAILAQRAGQRLDPNILLAQLKADEPYFTTPATKGKPFGMQAQSDWQSTLDAMRSAGILKAPVKPADVFTNQFISKRSSRAAAAARG